MAPTCYNSMKNLHYRTQSLPESVYQHQMLHLTQHHPHDQFHHGHHQHHQLVGGPQHPSVIKKRNALRRSQTSVCDLLQGGMSHHRAPLTAGLYEQFLPPPNFNAIGLPVQSRVARTRAQSFYVGSSSHHYRSAMSRLNMNNMAASHLDLHNSSPYSYPVCDQSSSWYHRSVPNIPSSYQTQQSSSKSVTSPLFVDCSVEYDLGDQPVIPADSEPLLSIHPDYIAKCRSLPSSPYDKLQRPSRRAGVGQEVPMSESRMDMRPSCGRVARSIRSSPKHAAPPRSNLSSKLEATRKLSVESRDSGIGMMNSAGTVCNQWPMIYNNSACDMTTMTTPFSTSGAGQQAPAFPLGHQAESQHQNQTEYMGKLLPSSNKRFALSDIVSGLLCCSVPPYHNHDWRADNNNVSNVSNGHVTRPGDTFVPDTRTMEWVMASQKARNTCKHGGQDCGDGFCYNVWNNLVHV